MPTTMPAVAPGSPPETSSFRGVPTQTPPAQTSPAVKSKPSLHAVPLGSGSYTHSPLARSQLAAPRHSPGGPPQSTPLHGSAVVSVSVAEVVVVEVVVVEVVVELVVGVDDVAVDVVRGRVVVALHKT